MYTIDNHSIEHQFGDYNLAIQVGLKSVSSKWYFTIKGGCSASGTNTTLGTGSSTSTNYPLNFNGVLGVNVTATFGSSKWTFVAKLFINGVNTGISTSFQCSNFPYTSTFPAYLHVGGNNVLKTTNPAAFGLYSNAKLYNSNPQTASFSVEEVSAVNTNSNTNVGLYAGIGVGVAVLIAGIIIFVVIRKLRAERYEIP